MVLSIRGECGYADTGPEQGALCGVAVAQWSGAEAAEAESREWSGPWLVSLGGDAYRGGSRLAWRDGTAERLL